MPRSRGGKGQESEPASVSPGFFSGSPLSISLSISLLLVLGYGAARTYHEYVNQWARSAAPYYKGNEALIRAADLMNAHPEADPYVATYFQQHATLAVAADRYPDIRWMSGRTVVLPPPGARPALLVYDHTTPIDPVLRERLLAPDALFHRELGPDGEVGFEAYRVSGDQAAVSGFAPQAPGFAPQAPVRANLGHTLTFLGYDLNAPPVSGDVLDVTLYFEVQRAVEQDDWTFFAHLTDDLGYRWGGKTFFHYPSAQWRPGEVIAFRQQLEIAPGAPPGAYTLDVGVFSPSLDARLPVLEQAESGVWRMAGTALPAGPIKVARAAAPPADLPAALSAIQQPLQASFVAPETGGLTKDVVRYLGSDRDRSDLRPGETLALTLYWQAGPAVDRAHAVSVSLTKGGQEVPLWEGDPVHGLYPFPDWQPGEFVRDRYALRLPLDLAAGDYELRLALLGEDGAPLPIGKGASHSDAIAEDAISLGTIHVHASDRLWEAPAFEHPVGARLGQQVELLGYDLVRDGVAPGDRVGPGDTLHLTLVWRALEPMDIAYTVFTHLLDEGGQVRGQKDNPPVQGSYPTPLWVPGEVVVDTFEIPVAADAAPGSYHIEVGMYDPLTMQRLPVLDPTGTLGDRVLLGRVEVGD